MGKKAPKPPDPKETASAQTATNIGTAIANSYMGNVNQVTPDGSLTYSQSGTQKWTDPLNGKVYDIPTWTATQTLSQAQQAIKGQNDAAEPCEARQHAVGATERSSREPGQYRQPPGLGRSDESRSAELHAVW